MSVVLAAFTSFVQLTLTPMTDEVDIPVACLFQWGDNAEILLRLAGSFAFKP
jgi:hypothetical protein